ncbi:MAG: RDD family protein [Betaproteobacteria bacterium]|nr:RDD family protein [Betaproteobacteria bacterium]
MTEEQGNIYAPTEVRVDDVRVEGDIELASRWSRLGAAIVDTIIIGVPIWGLYFLLLDDPLNVTGKVAQSWVSEFFGSLAMFAVAFAFYAAINWFPLQASGQTWGKKLLAIRIVRGDGSPVDAKRVLFIRYLPIQTVSMVPFIGTLVALVNAVMIFRESRKCLHDDIADTVVVKA